MQVDTQGYGGRNIRELAIVHTNAFSRPKFNLAMMGTVEKFAEIDPPRARLFGRANQDIQTVVRITARDKYPFTITGVRSENPGHVSFKLEPQPPEPGSDSGSDSGSAYLLTITNLRRDPGRWFDTLILETDSDIMPEIKYFVIGIISNPQ